MWMKICSRKLETPSSCEGQVDHRPFSHHRWNLEPNRDRLLDHAAVVTVKAGKQPGVARTGAPGAGLEDGHRDRQYSASRRFLGREHDVAVERFQALCLGNPDSGEVPDQAVEHRLE